MTRRHRALAFAAYLGSMALAVLIGALDDRALAWSHPAPWLALGAASPYVSLACGVALGLAIVGATRWLVRRTEWARSLRRDLRHAVHGLSATELAALGASAALAEEWLFRGALQPLAGLALTSLVFGALHAIGGRRYLPWAACATLVGLALGVVFEATGSLVGPIVGHAIVNVLNLRFVAQHRPGLDFVDRASTPPRLVAARVRAR